MEKPSKNRLVEDTGFNNRIHNKILDELENLSRTFDAQMEERSGGSWKERIDKIKAGEKLGAESAVEDIVVKIALDSGLSTAELNYLINSIFTPRPFRKTEDD